MLSPGRVRDLADQAMRNDYVTHTGFLSLSEQSMAVPETEKAGVRACFYGGHEEADRKILYFLPSYMDEETLTRQEDSGEGFIACLRIRVRGARFTKEIGHRDCLGALMHLGIEREQIGDILTEASHAFVFVMKDIGPFIISELTRVSHTVVSVREVPLSACQIRPVLEERTGSVASERLDAVTAMAFRLSRTAAAKLIEGEKAAVDGRLVTDPDRRLLPGQKISLRGYGRFLYQGEVKRTKKDRLMVRVFLYR